MSKQVLDELLLNGEQVALFETPLSGYLSGREQGWPFVSRITANARGYVATWEMRDGALLLVRLRGWLARRPFSATTPGSVTIRENLAALSELRQAGDPQEFSIGFDGPDVPLSLFFPGNPGPVEATWFSGTLRVPMGKQVADLGTWSTSVFERELRIAIDHGVVTGTDLISPIERPDKSQRYALAVAGVALPARVDAAGRVECPLCDARFSVSDKASWDGEHHSCGCRIRLRDVEAGRESPPEA